MFKFLKQKLKDSISKISKKIEEEGTEEIVEEEVKENVPEVKEEIKEQVEDVALKEEVKEPEKKGFFARIKDKFGKKEEIDEKEFKEVELKDEVTRVLEKKEIKKEENVLDKKEEEIKEKIEKKEPPTIQQLTERKEQKERVVEKKQDENVIDKEEIKEQVDIVPIKEEAKEPEKKGFFGKIKEKIVTKKINEDQFEELFWNLETSLLENNVAVEVIEKLKDDLKKSLVGTPIKRAEIAKTVESVLRKSITELFDVDKINMDLKVKEKKPYVICFIGVNGSGKTTTISKIAYMLKNKGLKCVLVAADTFRAASIEQLQLHADKLGIKMIKHDYGSDPAAVAFDAIKHASAKDIDVVLIDTAGRMHSNQNLMDELKKVIRVAKPDLTLFVGESITGNDCVEQIKRFGEGIPIDGVVLTKADVDEKGGAAVSVSYVTKKPIVFIGVGQEYGDLKEFDSSVVMSSLGLES